MTGVRKKISIEATGGHHELGVLIAAIHNAVEKLRGDAQREFAEPTRPIYNVAPINLEGTIRIETEDDL